MDNFKRFIMLPLLLMALAIDVPADPVSVGSETPDVMVNASIMTDSEGLNTFMAAIDRMSAWPKIAAADENDANSHNHKFIFRTGACDSCHVDKDTGKSDQTFGNGDGDERAFAIIDHRMQSYRV